MRLALLSLLLVVYSAPATAGESVVFRATGETGRPAALRLFDEPCTDAAVVRQLVAKIRSDLVDGFRRGRLTWEGKDWESCWMLHEDVVYSIDEEGSMFQPIPLRLFKSDSV